MTGKFRFAKFVAVTLVLAGAIAVPALVAGSEDRSAEVYNPSVIGEVWLDIPNTSVWVARWMMPLEKHLIKWVACWVCLIPADRRLPNSPNKGMPMPSAFLVRYSKRSGWPSVSAD